MVKLRALILGALVLFGCGSGVASSPPGGDAPGDAGNHEDAAGTSDDSDSGSNGGDGGGSDDASNDDDLAALPPDTGGTHIAVPLGSSAAAYGYYVYLPGGYTSTTAEYPVIIFLHGQGQRGDGTSTLDKVLDLGIPKLIKDGNWNPTHPMIVVSPQYPTNGPGNANNWGGGTSSRIKGFIEHVMATYRVNPKRIYLTGLSHGGNGVFDYLAQQVDTSNYLAAAAPVACWGASSVDESRHTPIWVFVGANDTQNANTSKNFVMSYNAQTPAPTHRAKLTVYPGAGHDVWTRTYSLSGLGTGDSTYDLYDMSLFDWMLQYKRAD
ncbi:MAG: hypothetical protein SFX73_19465 [Kofleriaceae bacterium]|nr:hypothetical protein [Kofleriaceae bacterium]